MTLASPAPLRPLHKRTLIFGGVATTIFGVAFAVAAVVVPNFIEALYQLAAAPGVATDVGPTARLATGIYGGLMAGWGVMLTLLGRDLPVARAAAWGLVAWWVVDSSASIATGFPWNALSNAAFLAMFAPLLPVLARRRNAT